MLVNGTDLGTLKGGPLRRLRQDHQFVFQDPYASLNPRMRVKEIISEPLDIARRGSPGERTDTVRWLLDEVGLAHYAMDRYPHEFSGLREPRAGIGGQLPGRDDLVAARRFAAPAGAPAACPGRCPYTPHPGRDLCLTSARRN